MVIIAREFAVTVSRMAASQQGLVISAGSWGKVKTAVQVVAVFFLIAVDGSHLWLDLLVIATVGITIASGVDYFFGLRRLLREAEAARRTAEASST
jgi:CDP-diacylglycerol--glycerol-3-phosphate 3-phosphatidyltransferase